MSYLLSVDPGINACGVSIWDERPRNMGRRLIPNEAFNIYASDLTIPWFERIAELVGKLNMLVGQRKFKWIVTEFPQFFEGVKGNAAAKNGDVTHMAHFCGLLHNWAYCNNYSFFPIEVTTWKGQLSKEIVEKRLKRAVGTRDRCNKKITDHAWDAVGVGLVFCGYKLNDTKVYGKHKDE